MAEGQSLGTLISNLRLESGRSQTPGLGVSERPALIRIINRVYSQFWLDFNWPLLKVRRDKDLNQGQRFYDFPTDIDANRVLSIVTNYGGKWSPPVKRGIDMEQYNILNSDNGETQDPVRRWDMLRTGPSVQLEAWPIPASNNLTMRIEGILKFQPLVSDDDICLLDEDMIILKCAAEMLGKTSKGDAKLKLDASQQIYDSLKQGYEHETPNKINMNGDINEIRRRDTPGSRILVAKATN